MCETYTLGTAWDEGGWDFDVDEVYVDEFDDRQRGRKRRHRSYDDETQSPLRTITNGPSDHYSCMKCRSVSRQGDVSAAAVEFIAAIEMMMKDSEHRGSPRMNHQGNENPTHMTMGLKSLLADYDFTLELAATSEIDNDVNFVMNLPRAGTYGAHRVQKSSAISESIMSGCESPVRDEFPVVNTAPVQLQAVKAVMKCACCGEQGRYTKSCGKGHKCKAGKCTVRIPQSLGQDRPLPVEELVYRISCPLCSTENRFRSDAREIECWECQNRMIVTLKEPD